MKYSLTLCREKNNVDVIYNRRLMCCNIAQPNPKLETLQKPCPKNSHLMSAKYFADIL